MKRRPLSINLYFSWMAMLLGLVLAGGCSTTDKDPAHKDWKKEQSTIRLYMEGPRADSTTAGTVLVTRERFPFTVQREPFLTEADLSKALLVDNSDGTYYIELVFDEHATLVLEMYTADNSGRHIIVFSQFPKPGRKAKEAREKSGNKDDDDVVPASEPVAANKPRESGWLAAVLIHGRIANGVFRFTPDATKAEGERIVRGLKNVLSKKKKEDK